MNTTIAYLKNLRETFMEAFVKLETKGRFERKPWNYSGGKGGGEMAVLRGEVFEKAAVNFSKVEGDKFPGSDAKGPFMATGVSLITHMQNPKAPTAHFNLRYIETPDKKWFGGGFDLTPMGFPFIEDTKHFHAIAKKVLDPFGKNIYETFSRQAKEYFTIKHYGVERGVGGIFFDHYNTGNLEEDFKMWSSVGNHFLEAIIPIYQKRIVEPYSEADRETQLKQRGRYVEFNLIYDRGTKFGLESGGNPEAILCSLPPLVSW
ncbi:MAG: oxygen-dependent coproporphyrinogen oxidase [Deltaproteobacteria bacterium]|nr:oxygen-dependent coproporphyrinogen oxidase [Deltaproteobacteria bacterium]